MSLVRVKDGSKRTREPQVLTVEEFRGLLEHIPQPFQTMCIVAMCTGLRVSEVLGLEWCIVDWEGLRLGIRQQLYAFLFKQVIVMEPGICTAASFNLLHATCFRKRGFRPWPTVSRTCS